jgi:hypothetical protein
MATIYSDSFYTTDSIHVGTTIDKFLRIHGKQKIMHDPDYGLCFEAATGGITYYVAFFNRDSVPSPCNIVDEGTYDYSHNGFIDAIHIYNPAGQNTTGSACG